MIAIFLVSLIPPACAMSGWMMSMQPASKYGRTSRRVNSRSPSCDVSRDSFRDETGGGGGDGDRGTNAQQ